MTKESYSAPSESPFRHADIKAILDTLISGYSQQQIDSLPETHGDPNFGWDSVEQMQQVVVRPDGLGGPEFRLVDMDLIREGRGDETNLVKALRDATGVNFRGRMPYFPVAPSRYATDEEIQQIVDWLNAGMPD